MYRIKIQKRKEKDEENEKATVIQQLYRKKLQKRKEQQEENDKATLIQRKYRIMLQERKQKEEENEKASMIQKMYRAKKVKQQLRDNKEEHGQNTANGRKKQPKIDTQHSIISDVLSPLPKVIINKPNEEQEILREQNEKALFIQKRFRDRQKKRNEVAQPEVDKVLGVVIDDAIQSKAKFIQRHYRNKKAKQRTPSDLPEDENTGSSFRKISKGDKGQSTLN